MPIVLDVMIITSITIDVINQAALVVRLLLMLSFVMIVMIVMIATQKRGRAAVANSYTAEETVHDGNLEFPILLPHPSTTEFSRVENFRKGLARNLQ